MRKLQQVTGACANPPLWTCRYGTWLPSLNEHGCPCLSAWMGLQTKKKSAGAPERLMLKLQTAHSLQWRHTCATVNLLQL